MKKYLSKFGAWLSVLPVLFAPSVVLAGDPADPGQFLNSTGGNTIKDALGGTQQSLPTIIGNLINVLISVLGIVFVVLIVYAGYLYLTAAGDDKKVTKAKSLIGQATIGLVLILAAYGIASFVIDQLMNVALS